MQMTKARREAFCRWYLTLGNAAEAAQRIGIPPAAAGEVGLQLLHSPACRRFLAECSGEPAASVRSMVLAGLARLAFGSANDAVQLVFSDECLPPARIAALDLFHVAELKRGKGNSAVEIKLFDRQKAMEKLLECAGDDDASAAAEALLKALSGEADDGGELSSDALFQKAADGSELVETEGE